MAKDPAVLFYTNDFISGTYTMTDEQVGKYIRLLCIQHQKGHLTEKDMLNICKTYDEDIYLKFEIIDGKYINKRLAEESLRRKKYSESRRKNREKTDSIAKIDNNDNSNDNDMNDISNSYDIHMEAETETITENEIKKNKKSENFLNFIPIELDNDNFKTVWLEWITFRKEVKSKLTKSTAIKQFQFLTKNKDNAVDIINQSIQSGWKGLFEIKKTFNNNGTITETKRDRHIREVTAMEELLRNVTAEQ